jgi:hypothetical protein
VLDQPAGRQQASQRPPRADHAKVDVGAVAGDNVGEVIYAVQVYQTLEPTSLTQVQAMFDWSRRRTYDLNSAGGNHGLLLGTTGWRPLDIPG